MCCTLAPAELSDTIVYAHKMNDGRHVLAYQNKAQSTPNYYSATNPLVYNRTGRAKPEDVVNAMILPIPAKEEIGPQNAVDLREDPTVLKDYARAVQTQHQYKGVSRSMMLSDSVVQVFKTGSYEVVTTKEPWLIPEVVKELHPEINVGVELMDAYAKAYQGWNVAICFFSGSIEPEPIMFTYESMYQNHLFLPTLDSHDGGRPRRYAKLDHTIVVGSVVAGKQVNRKTPSHLKPYLSDQVIGFEAKHSSLNGDFWFPILRRDVELEWAKDVTLRLPAGTRPE